MIVQSSVRGFVSHVRILGIVCLYLLVMPSVARAQASLAAENIIDDVVVGDTTFTLFRDARNPEQWYYVPNQPRLVTRSVGSTSEPEFSLIRYQFAEPANPEHLLEEGILQFAATLAAPPNAIQAFKTAIAARTEAKNVRISAIPFKSAEVSLYTYAAPGQKSSLISFAPYGSGLAPLFASQKLVFSVPLTKIGTDVMDALVSKTGMPVAVTFTFNALTPPAGFKVTMNWSQIFEHYSKDEKFRASASYFGWFGASYESSVQQIREQLLSNKDITIEAISGEAFKQEEIDKYLQPILARINDELIEASRPPAQIDPASASAPSAGGWLGSAGYSVAIKDVKKVKRGSETWTMTVQQIVDRKTVAQGLIGIGEYPQEVRDKLVTMVPPSKFSSAYLVLPSPAILGELGVSSIDLQVSLQNAGNTLASQVVKWQPGGAWKDIGGRERTSLVFPLTGLSQEKPQTLGFRAKLRLTTNRQVLDLESAVPATNGEQAMLGVNGALFDVLEFDASQLPFASLSSSGDLLQGNVSVKIADQTISVPIRPKNVDGKFVPPDPIRLLVPHLGTAQRAPSAQIVFQLKGGRTARWRYNGNDIVRQFGGTSVSLDDADIVRP
ncbi:MAG TPA: hypothetical protein VGQ21_18675 [Thermoanaerobaculia bacterium]|jgi:hypothetical protein|nr:hypothetical protein [Thermoanaerobaculia bacterium]